MCVECVTNYPFDDVVRYEITADAPVDFTLRLHIPPHAGKAFLDGEPVETGSVVHLRRTWEGHSAVQLTFDFDVVTQEDPATTALPTEQKLWYVTRGPLVFALPISGIFTKREYTRDGVERVFPYCDYEIRPASDWEFGLDKTAAQDCIKLQFHDISAHPFDEKQPPVTLTLPLRPIHWGYAPEHNGALAAELPHDYTPIGDAVSMRLQPYGATMLRMTSLPLV